MILIVNFALKSELKDYTPFFEAIKACGEWWHFLDSTWIISTQHSTQTVAEHLTQFIDTTTDYLLVARLQREHQGWLPKAAWDWMNSKLY
jgi:hypothetical protein